MHFLEFFSKLIDSIVWPITTVIIFLSLRDDIAKLVPSIKKLKAGPVEAEFASEMKALTVAAQSMRKPLNVRESQKVDVASKNFLHQLAELHPRSAILESWVRVEAAARVALAHKSTSVVSPNYVPASRLAEPLAEKEILDPAEVILFNEIRRLRNDVAHAQGFEPTQDSAHQYIDLAAGLLAKLEQFEN